jgi:hypothetical protein
MVVVVLVGRVKRTALGPEVVVIVVVVMVVAIGGVRVAPCRVR